MYDAQAWQKLGMILPLLIEFIKKEQLRASVSSRSNFMRSLEFLPVHYSVSIHIPKETPST